MAALSPRRFRLARILPWLALAVLTLYSYAYFFVLPYAGFRYAPDGRVLLVMVTAAPARTVAVGDRLLRVGAVRWPEFETDLRQRLFQDLAAGQTVELTLQRGTETLTIPWAFPGPTLDEILERLNSQWWLPYVFWLAGTATLFLVRPKDARWRLLIAFSYLTAFWLTAGVAAISRTWESAVVLRSAIWLCVPIYLQLHWSFPVTLGRLPAPIVWGGYAAGAAFALAEWFQIPPPNTFLFGFLLAVGGSLTLLLTRVLLRPAQRQDVAFLAASVALVFLPVVVVSAANALGLRPPSFASGGALMAIPALPGAYFYVAYRPRLGAQEGRARRVARLYLALVLLGSLVMLVLSLVEPQVEAEEVGQAAARVGLSLSLLAALIAALTFTPFLALPAIAGRAAHQAGETGELELRAHRLLPAFLFFLTLGTASVLLVALADLTLRFPGAPFLIGAAVSTLAALAGALGYRPFCRAIEHRLLGMPLEPSRLLQAYAARITTSLQRENLASLLRDDVLPTMLVRQSALLSLNDDGRLSVVYSSGVQPEDLPSKDDVSELPLRPEVRLPLPATDRFSERFPWVQLVLPLRLGHELLGLWLLGQHDPDNLYGQEEVSILQAMAHQTAIALANIAQAERLRALYQADTTRDEAERARLARELHDDVLNELALLHTDLDGERSPAHLDRRLLALMERTRQIVRDMRPATLTYGLYPALEELTEGLSERVGDKLRIRLEAPRSAVRHPPQVEEHVFRILQQACENVLRHARARSLRIHGLFEPDRIDLAVEDDGVGLPFEGALDLDGLLAGGHYGLAGMCERGEMIGAKVHVHSVTGRGTRIRVTWVSSGDQPAAHEP